MSMVSKILRVGHELILGEGSCLEVVESCLEVVDIKTLNITSSHRFTETSRILDILAIDDSHYLLCTLNGLMKTTKDQLIKHYY